MWLSLAIFMDNRDGLLPLSCDWLHLVSIRQTGIVELCRGKIIKESLEKGKYTFSRKYLGYNKNFEYKITYNLVSIYQTIVVYTGMFVYDFVQ